MTTTTRVTRAYLKQIEKADRAIAAAKAQMRDLDKSVTYLSGISYDRERVQTSSSGAASYENAVLDLVDTKKELTAKIATAEARKHKIIAQIWNIEDIRTSELLAERYISGLSNMEIADKHCLSEEWVRHLMSDALSIFCRTYKTDVSEFLEKGAF